MEIRIRATGALVTDQEFRAMHPNTTMPVPLTEATVNDFGGDVVLEGPQAQPTRYQVAHRDGVQQIDGKWFTKYSTSAMDADAISAVDKQQAAAVRADRDQRIAKTDWRFRSDMAPTQAWKDYCQALRDVTKQAGFPWDIHWPSEPKQSGESSDHK